MNRILTRFVIANLAIVAAACTQQVSQNTRSAIVVGTVLDAASGEPIAEVRVEGPGGKHATSDASGHFQFAAFPVGTEGEITAKTADGRSGRVMLRKLEPRPLEVVLQLSKP
jgi:hypothetical protein